MSGFYTDYSQWKHAIENLCNTKNIIVLPNEVTSIRNLPSECFSYDYIAYNRYDNRHFTITVGYDDTLEKSHGNIVKLDLDFVEKYGSIRYIIRNDWDVSLAFDEPFREETLDVLSDEFIRFAQTRNSDNSTSNLSDGKFWYYLNLA